MILPNSAEIADWLGLFLSSSQRLTVEITDIEAALTAAFPQLQGDAARYELLSAAIFELKDRGVVRFHETPGNAVSYYRKTFLPKRFVINRQKAQSVEAAPVIWHPKLQSAAQVKDRRQIEKLISINKWLISYSGPEDEILTAQERSLQIFGAEKVLSKFSIILPDGTEIGPEFLRFRHVEPMIYHSLPMEQTNSKVGLIVENIATADDFSEWNDRMRHFALVVCSEGKRILAAPNRLKKLAERYGVSEWLYFGDIDPEGFKIALEVTHASEEIGGPVVRPHPAAYRWLARYGEVVTQSAKTQDEAGLWTKIREAVIEWTDSPIVVARGDEVVREGKLIPQEWLGRSILNRSSFLEEIARYRPYIAP